MTDQITTSLRATLPGQWFARVVDQTKHKVKIKCLLPFLSLTILTTLRTISTMDVDEPPTGSSFLLLPNELLVRIIRMACGSGPERYYFDTPYRSAQTLQRLAHTCTLLRQIIKGDADTVKQPVVPPPNIMRDLPLLCEERWVDAAAGNGTPHIVIRADIPNPDTDVARTLNRALSSISRVQTLILQGCDETLDSYPLDYTSAQSASALETLRLSSMYIESLFWRRALLPELPSLEILQLRSCLVSMANPLLRSTPLTTLILENVTFGIWNRDDDCNPESFAHMLRSCSETLRELIVYDTHMFVDAAEPPSMTKYEPNLSKVVRFPVLEKVSFCAITQALTRVVAHLDMPCLRIAKVTPIVGHTPFDCDFLRDVLLPRISKSLMRCGETFDTALVDQDYARIVATCESRVLDLSVLCCVPPGEDPEHWQRDLTILRRLIPECIRRTTRVHIKACCLDVPQSRECQLLLTDVFMRVVVLALHGMCVPFMVLALRTRRFFEVAPSLRIISISGDTTSNGGPHSFIRHALGFNDLWLMTKLRKVHILYDSVMAPLLSDVRPAHSDDDMKEEMRYMLGIVSSEWEEFTHSLVAEDLAKFGRAGVGAEVEEHPQVLLL